MTALLTWPTHFSASHPPFYLKPRAVPLTRWLPNIFLFFTVNVLNNFAFGYNISVPVHIILRSGGSVTTMLVGFLWGKRYSQMQVFSVAMLTVGIIIAAMADAQSKVILSITKVPCMPNARILGQSFNGQLQNRPFLRHWPLHPRPRPASVRDHGTIHAADLRRVRLPLARESLLQPLSLHPLLPSIPSFTSYKLSSPALLIPYNRIPLNPISQVYHRNIHRTTWPHTPIPYMAIHHCSPTYRQPSPQRFNSVCLHPWR